MSVVTIRVLDTTGSRARTIEAPDDAPVERLLVLLVERMGLPINAPDGQLMSYKLHDRRSGRQLLDSETLHDAGVEAGAELRLQAEITAGTAKV